MEDTFLNSHTLDTSSLAEAEDEVKDPSDVASTSQGVAGKLPVADDWDPDSPALVSINFLLRNFSEMNKLWTRMQRNLPPSDARDIIRTVRPPAVLPTHRPCLSVQHERCPQCMTDLPPHSQQTLLCALREYNAHKCTEPLEPMPEWTPVMQQLAELVGKNLNQLAGLGGLTFSHYQNLVLPCITEQIVQCQDKLAQRFLMEVRSV